MAHENITVHRIPLTLVHDWLMEQMEQGKVVDPKIFMGLYFLSRSVNGMGLEPCVVNVGMQEMVRDAGHMRRLSGKMIHQ